ncbi:hypothetical protein OIU74_010509 [Salix koriyanagi]|uniref:Uncharacterized protein n=1 Tax=Salix koriyanagi TaxID=2511006 RepID=A0A9Q0TD25_9ROSI|nr:hypothetical protein OIU74_010509 [Salix koriyanagi]
MRSQGQAQDPVHKGPNISTATVSGSQHLLFFSHFAPSGVLFPVRIMLGLRGSVRLLTEINQSLVQNATVSLTSTYLFTTRLL